MDCEMLANVKKLMILDSNHYYPGNQIARHFSHDFACHLTFFSNVKLLPLELPYIYPMAFSELDRDDLAEEQMDRDRNKIFSAVCYVPPGGIRNFVPGTGVDVQWIADYQMCQLARFAYISYRAPEDLPWDEFPSPRAPRHLSTRLLEQLDWEDDDYEM
jgi:hypothetical protein